MMIAQSSPLLQAKQTPRSLPLKKGGRPPLTVYVLVAIVKKRLGLEASLYTLMQVLSVTIFEKMPLQTALSSDQPKSDTSMDSNQLNLFGF
jgi:hypothetical protein